MYEKNNAHLTRCYVVVSGAYFLVTAEAGEHTWNRDGSNVVMFQSSGEAKGFLAMLGTAVPKNVAIVPLLHFCVAVYELSYESAAAAVDMLGQSIGVKDHTVLGKFLCFTPQNIEGVDTFMKVGGIIVYPKLRFALDTMVYIDPML